MTRERYDLLMSEMDKIAEKVKLFPHGVQESVFKALIDALLQSEPISPDENSVEPANSESEDSIGRPEERPSDEMEFIAMVKRHGDEHRLAQITHPQFATYAAFVFSELAPEDMRKDEIGKAELEKVYQIAGRKPPVNLSNQLNAARRKLKYLTNGGVRGTFKLTSQGRYYVEHDLLGSGEK